ncbi:MAG TPA: pantoate--beta-alanine ligase [Saprospiraceae bacterium]|nr:pantoate--beta-alanine ligase [Saprospiraceae bacterium]HNM27221.1 pantoate--beta-alanine ligase [Saprospiraceae bacterium]
MLLVKTIADYDAWRSAPGRKNRDIGFAPTMGALHEGHLELVRMARRAGDLAVVSIFVNPTQFNDPKDLEKYPRTPGRDIELLLSAGCDLLFLPAVEEVYPPGRDLSLQLEFGPLDKVMEGAFRPGHFAGMATVVNRLLDIMRPVRLYMGQKDFQQLTIVRDMLRQLKSPVELVMCPTVREADGLAMSSRNTRLSPEMRRIAPVIHETLEAAQIAFRQQPASLVCQNALTRLAEAGLKPEYFELADGYTLQPVANWQDASFVVACTAAWAGDVRLIDNLIVKTP